MKCFSLVVCICVLGDPLADNLPTELPAFHNQVDRLIARRG